MTTHEISPIFFSVAFLAGGQAHQFSTCLARSRMLQKNTLQLLHILRSNGLEKISSG
jgi:hypothetical protein